MITMTCSLTFLHSEEDTGVECCGAEVSSTALVPEQLVLRLLKLPRPLHPLLILQYGVYI